MRKNRKIPKKMSVVATNTMRFGAIIVFLFVMVILNFLASSSCAQLMKIKGDKERELVRLDEAHMREATRWEEMKTPEKVETALLRHGLAMKLPRPDQSIRMRTDGTPYPGQPSLARLKQRSGAVMTARAVVARPTVSSQSRRRRTR